MGTEDNHKPITTMEEFLSARKDLLNVAAPQLMQPFVLTNEIELPFEFESTGGLDTTEILKDLSISENYCIALLDTGVSKHPNLLDKNITRLSSNGDTNDVDDLHGHGTHIAGIISATKTYYKKHKIEGMVPGAPIVSFKLTEKEFSETRWTIVADALQGVIEFNNDKQNKRKISVVNLSFNAFDNWNDDKEMQSHRLYKIIHELHCANIPVVVSGGNHFDAFGKNDEPGYGLAYPANCKDVIACGAACHQGKITRAKGNKKDVDAEDLAPFTQRPDPDNENQKFFTAPALVTVSTGIAPSNFSILAGSSMAAPIITGIIFILQQWAKQNRKYNGELPPVEDIRKALVEGSNPLPNIGRSEFKAGIKPTSKFFDNKNYLHVNVNEIFNKFKNNLTKKTNEHATK